MKKMVDLLPADRFCRIHKSFIVSLSKVNTIDKGRVYIGKESFPIGATYRPVFMDLIKTHMG
jgi:DNA-binding LytR/AlgR family response regulator